MARPTTLLRIDVHPRYAVRLWMDGPQEAECHECGTLGTCGVYIGVFDRTKGEYYSVSEGWLCPQCAADYQAHPWPA